MRERNAWKLLIALAVFFLYWLSDMDGFSLSVRGWMLLIGCVVASVGFLLRKLGKKMGSRFVTCPHCGKELPARAKECPYCRGKSK